MRLTHFYTLVGLIFLTSLWFVGISLSELVIVFFLLSMNAAFQLWVRGNVKWNQGVNTGEIKEKIPMWIYSSVSAAGLIALVIYISSITRGV
jgi:hypothetical protein